MSAAPSDYHGITLPEDWICECCGKARREHPPACPTSGAPQFTRVGAGFVAMLRVKNEARWIAEVIEGALLLCSRVFVFDDNSTDETMAICHRYGDKVVIFPSPFAGFNEARDKNWLFDQIMTRCAPEWILCIDGDEVLTAESAEAIRTATADPDTPAYSLQIWFLWNNRQTVRTDWVYGEFWRPSLFKPFHITPDTPDHVKLARSLRFMETPFGRVNGDDKPNLHCSSVPQAYLGRSKRCPGASLLHLGYMHREDRVRKLDFYTGCDWANLSEDCYRHMTQGDGVTVEELPKTRDLLAAGRLTEADVRFMTDLPADVAHGQTWNGRPLLHAGPLTLRAI